MPDQDDFDVDKILRDLFRPAPEKAPTLRELFNRRLIALSMSPTRAAKLLEVERRTLNGVLDGMQRRVGSATLLGLASFLQIPVEQVTQLYFDALGKNFPEELTPSISPDRAQFIRENFDLVALKKAGLLDSITDYPEIEKRIVRFYGLKSIEDYRGPLESVAFSAGITRANSSLIRTNWIRAAERVFEIIDNPIELDREALIEYFREIRWHSTNVELGLIDVIRRLATIGVTVIYQPPLMSLNLRGATLAVNGKPCIVLTDYKGFYPTLWFALVHELFHVIFDWEEIRNKTYHLSEDNANQLSVKERDDEADDFARSYLLSKEKTEQIRPNIRDQFQVRRFAEANQVHESFIYVFNAFDTGKTDRMAWPRAKRHNPSIDGLLKRLGNAWEPSATARDRAISIETTLYRNTP